MLNEKVSYKEAYEREKKARLAAEELLENKTREIFTINEQLKTQAQALERSNEELTQFAFVASHDLKEPLRKIKTFSGFLMEEFLPQLPQDAQDYLTRVNNAVDRMDALIEGLLHYSRITRNTEPFTQVNLNAIIQEVLSDLETRINETQATINVPENLPVIEANGMMIRQLLQNLISNSLKFHQKDKPPIISITARIFLNEKNISDITPKCEIQIKDNGIGFDEKYIDKIFGIFQRLHSHTEYEGSGIGLAVCKRIIDRHKGTIEVKSKPAVGTTFIITLPITQTR